MSSEKGLAGADHVNLLNQILEALRQARDELLAEADRLSAEGGGEWSARLHAFTRGQAVGLVAALALVERVGFKKTLPEEPATAGNFSGSGVPKLSELVIEVTAALVELFRVSVRCGEGFQVVRDDETGDWVLEDRASGDWYLQGHSYQALSVIAARVVKSEEGS